MNKEHIRYEVGVYLPYEGKGTKEVKYEPCQIYDPETGEWIMGERPIKKINFRLDSEPTYFYIDEENSTLPLPLPEYFSPNQFDPVEHVETYLIQFQDILLHWSWGGYVMDEPEREEDHYFYHFRVDRTFRVDKAPFAIKTYRNGPSKNLIVGGSTHRGVRSLIIFFFQDGVPFVGPTPSIRFTKLSLIRFPGHYPETGQGQREFLEHFFKHWWGLDQEAGSPFIFHPQTKGK